MTSDAQKLDRALREKKEQILALYDAGVLDLSEGKVEVNCHNGQIQKILIHRVTFRRKKM